MFEYELLASEGMAKRGRFHTAHGVVETPVFMNVATAAAIKGAVSSMDLKQIKCQVALANTYHLHVRPGDDVVRDMGGIRRFMAWDGPIVTDSGGFQAYSLADIRRITEEGVVFASHIDGRKIFMSPEACMRIQSNIGSTVAMALDECPPHPATREYMQDSVDRTTRWLARCQGELARLNAVGGAGNAVNAVNPEQLLFGINQGGTFPDVRVEHAKVIREMELPGYAVGGLAVGESHEEMYGVLEAVTPLLPRDKPTYLMGVGTPENILESVHRGIDFFDCVLPARNGRHGHVYTNAGKLNLFNARFERDGGPISEECGCPVCGAYSRAYIRHLFKAKEMLAMRLCVLHNLYFFNNMMEEIRAALDAGSYERYKRGKLSGFQREA